MARRKKIIRIVNSNLQREFILHSEKAAAFLMKRDAVQRKAAIEGGPEDDYHLSRGEQLFDP